ncbi:MAG: nucleotide sugar dehydrogenase [Chloroflexi bacterium]|nr:nucleotide sugar dehydrogenase [Chloroflexota bacterium]
MRVAVVGLGKIGLPLAVQYASKGCAVLGCDIDPSVVAAVNQGLSPVREEAELDAGLAREVAAGRLRATTDTSAAVAASEVVVVIVPLMVDHGPDRQLDYRALDCATRDVGRGLRPGALVIYETTLPVGATRGRLGPALAAASGLAPGRDFWLAFSPERVYSGRIFLDLRRYPKIVGGVDPESTARAAAFYRRVLEAEVIAVDSAETSEFSKLVETTYRDVNIALANEFALYAAQRGIDAQQAIDAANTQPYAHVHRPGLGVGGHCIPVYPYFLIHDAPEGMHLPRLARRVNDEMAGRGVWLLAEALGTLRGTTVLVLGLAYREDVKETAFSPAWTLVQELRRAGARPLVHDPLFSADELRRFELEPADLATLPPVDAVVLQAYHGRYRDLDWAAMPGRVVLDGRSVLDAAAIRAAGKRYLAIGRPPA